MALPEVTRGLMPGGGGTQNLPRAAGGRRAKELIMTGQAFDAEQGYAWGIVNKVCDNELEEALSTAGQISDNAPLAVRQAKKSIHYGLPLDLMTGYRLEIEAYNQLVGTEDRREGVRAFNEKRKPKFQGK
jgi:enoyl-CoA hydratase/carnithine racemase